MYPSLLLYSTARSIDDSNIVWILAFVLWIPQILAISYVLNKRKKARPNLMREMVQVLAPLGLSMIGVFSGGGILVLIAAMYVDVEWGHWLLSLALPTLLGVPFVVVSNRLYWRACTTLFVVYAPIEGPRVSLGYLAHHPRTDSKDSS